MSEESAEIIELFGVRFSGKRDLSTGRIFVPVSPESRAALAELGRVGREMARSDRDGTFGFEPRSSRLSEA